MQVVVGIRDEKSHAPLLHGKRFVLWNPQTDHLGLRVEAIEVYVRNNPERARCVVCSHLVEVAIRELRAFRGGGTSGRRVPERMRWRRHRGRRGFKYRDGIMKIARECSVVEFEHDAAEALCRWNAHSRSRGAVEAMVDASEKEPFKLPYMGGAGMGKQVSCTLPMSHKL